MYDLQVTYLRTTIPVRDLRPVATLKLAYPEAGVPSAITLDGTEVPFVITIDQKMLAVRPDTGARLANGQITGKVSGWNVVVTVTSDAGTWNVPYADTDLLEITAVFRVAVTDARTVVAVLVNGQTVGYTVVSDTVLLCEIPAVGRLDSVEVLGSTQNLTADALFEFQLSGAPALTRGLPKVTGQFLKVLLTTAGRDLVRPTLGTNVREIMVESTGTPGALSSLPDVIQRVTRAAAQVTASQATQAMPPEETLLAAQVVGLGVDPVDPSRAFVTIKLVTLAGIQATFGTYLSALGG